MRRYQILKTAQKDAKEQSSKLQGSLDLLLNARKSIAVTVAKHGDKWEAISPWYELSKFVVKRINASASLQFKNVSNAFCKAVELYSLLEFKDTNGVRHFDNASLPGDFVRAGQFVFDKHYWRASSLVCEDMGDRFNLVALNPQRWMMNADMDGDMTNLKSIECLSDQMQGWNTNLYTSDLGFAMNYAHLEEKQQMLGHFGQTIAGLKILQPNGVMICKQFTSYQFQTRWLINQLIGVFKSVELVKPEMSKADNSEVYLVCVGYSPDSAVTAAVTRAFQEIAANTWTNTDEDATNLIDVQVMLTARQVYKINKNIACFTGRKIVNWYGEAAMWCKSHNITLADDPVLRTNGGWNVHRSGLRSPSIVETASRKDEVCKGRT